MAQDVPTVPDDPTSTIPDPGSGTPDPTVPGGPLDQNLDNPGDLAPETDTDHTPKAKEGDERWEQIAGALFPQAAEADPTELVEGSATAFDVDLFAVSFRNTDHGFAGGARCRDEATPREGESPQDYARRTYGCTREPGRGVPVMYRYTAPPDGDPRWEQVDLHGDDSTLGYVGAIAWIDDDTALAVGGDGAYPRREASRDPTESYEQWVAKDPAGRGRAWIYDPERYGDEDFHELDLSEELAEGMRGMTALDFEHRSSPSFGMAGALGQLWRWDVASGEFTQRLDRNSVDKGNFSNETELVNAAYFDFRVRDLRFKPGEVPAVFAVTSGCCADVAAKNIPRVIRLAQGKWRLDALDTDPRSFQNALLPLGDANRVNLTPQLPDSFYAVTLGQPAGAFSVLASPGGQEADGERPSVISQRFCGTGASNVETILDRPIELTRASLSTARFVAAGEDLGIGTLSAAADLSELGRPSTLTWDALGGGCPNGTLGDAIPDWVLGELRSTRLSGIGARGLALTTVREKLAPDTVNVHLKGDEEAFGTEATTSEIQAGPTSYSATNDTKLRAYLRSAYFLLPSYSIGAVDFSDESGVGWAVGDHGAILRLDGTDGSGSAGNEPEPPSVRPGAGRQLPDAATYADRRPDSTLGSPGAVPALSVRPREELPEPRLIGDGFVDPTREEPPRQRTESVRQMVMSRDGGEGWAIGAIEPNQMQSTTTLYHYDGSTWSRCDFEGIGGIIDADPACAAVRGLRSWTSRTPQPVSVKLIAAARVPLENDADPSNDDQFEVVAIGTPYPDATDVAPLDGRPTIIRYRDGRWSFEDPASRAAIGTSSNTSGGGLTDVAFTAPDDGWILRGDGRLFHFNGTEWTDCSTAGGNCGDSGPRRTDFSSADEVKGILSVGDRLYMFGSRAAPPPDRQEYPMVIWRERGSERWHGSADGSDGGFDPGFDSDGDGRADGAAGGSGEVTSLSVAQGPDGHRGWAIGVFGRAASVAESLGGQIVGGGFAGSVPDGPTATVAMRLTPDAGWELYDDAGPLRDYLAPYLHSASPNTRRKSSRETLQVSLADGRAFVGQEDTGRILAFDPERERWRLVPAERPGDAFGQDGAVDGRVVAMVPDAEGGFWAAVGHVRQTYMFHYTDRPPAQVFEETANPIADSSLTLTSLAGGPDGTVWAATDSDILYRYDRVLGWDRIRIPGWDPGRVVTRPSEANAVAVGLNGEGLVVGRGGRIAELSPQDVRLDPAAGVLCAAGQSGPCGTGRDLQAAALSADGSAIVAGDHMTVLWRPAGGDFRAVAKPAAPQNAQITGVAMQSPTHAYLTNNRGTVYVGDMDAPGEWRWRIENRNASGTSLSNDTFGDPLPLYAIAVDEHGHGYAVGRKGLILERTGGGERPWRRLDTPYLDDLTAVSLPAGGGDGVLIGGEGGLVLTGNGGKFAVARPADYTSLGFDIIPNTGVTETTTDNFVTLPVEGLALLPGPEAGQVEAWVGVRRARWGSATANRLLHYASDPGEPLLAADRRSAPLADVPNPEPGELSVAAFGKSECTDAVAGSGARSVCMGPEGTTNQNQLIAQRVVEELRARSRRPGGPSLALLTGDGIDTAGSIGQAALEATASKQTHLGSGGSEQEAREQNGPVRMRRFAELYVEPLLESGIPVFGAVGGQDLSEVLACPRYLETAGCPGSSQVASAGDNLAWRHAFAGMAAPWGNSAPPGDTSLVLTPVPDSPGAELAKDVSTVEDPSGNNLDTDVKLAGARTHYAVDVARQEDPDHPIARLVVLDSSFGTTSTGDPVQNPRESDGQLQWLDRVTCFEAQNEGCTRAVDQEAIVLTNTPTYTYGPGLSQTDVAGAAALEKAFFDNHIKAVVTGRLGWNGLYYAQGDASGVTVSHAPAPGEAYPEKPPEPLAGQPDPIPFVIASSAGGRFNRDAEQSGGTPSSNGFWHGYSVIHLDPSGDYRKTFVEQRPILDWIQVQGPKRTVRAAQTLKLAGVGREPVGFTFGQQTTRFNEIISPAITHRYELLLADPGRPWLPMRDEGSADDATEIRSAASQRLRETDPCGPYLCLDPSIGTVDDQSGEVRAGNGQSPRTFAIAQLSVGDQSATYPLVFEPRASYRTPVPPPLAQVAVAPPPPPAAPANPSPPSVNLPAAPTLPILAAQSLAPPPAPPAPPTFASQAPLDLNIAPTALDVSPPTAVTQPPTPPVNPAPPSGARREARQRQAAAQKSGADSDQESSEVQELGGDGAGGPDQAHGSAATRHEHAFTALSSRSQPSAWARNALIGGGLGIAALVLALGLRTARPTPRRREPRLPAPALSRVHARGRGR